MIKLIKYAQKLEHIIAQKDKELKRLESINLVHIAAQKKRDEMIRHLVRELAILKQNSNTNNLIQPPTAGNEPENTKCKSPEKENKSLSPSPQLIPANARRVSMMAPLDLRARRPSSNGRFLQPSIILF